MADGHCRVAWIGLLHHQRGHRLAHDVRTAQYDAMLALGGDIIAFEQIHDAHRRGAHEARKANGKTSHIDRMESIHILAVVNGLDDLLAVDMLRQRKLHDEAVNLGILVQFVHLGKEFFLGDITLKTYQ